MLSITDADKMIHQNMPSYPDETIPLDEAYGRLLREDITADRDFPPFDKSLMDGIAIDISSWEMGNRRFPIEDTQAAGTAQLTLPHSDACIEIMTGAVVPNGANCVVPIEYFENDGGLAIIDDSYPLELYKNIRRQGADQQQGNVLIKAGCRIGTPQIAVCAAVGKSQIKVAACPQVAIISTGDEVVEIDQAVKPYQIRQSNAHFMKIALDQTRLVTAERFHFPDDKDLLLKEIANILNRFDILVLTGGVSMGKFDFVPQVLQELGCEVLFHKVQQKPGKPFWFGLSKSKQPIFALPGNPVSTQVGIYRHVIPNIQSALGLTPKKEYAVLTEDVRLDTKFAFFLTVSLTSTQAGIIEAKPVLTGGSGDFASVAESDGFIEIPAETNELKKGFIGTVYRW
ncbi:MAG: molybdopterin molybdotransferase MoeA [Candidatus Omnitrophica bacterium]|nr:molybdopterin molybdotransferase MoeA [Candidatus Omnitrophota bacterium]